jgi:hypothetical protein
MVEVSHDEQFIMRDLNHGEKWKEGFLDLNHGEKSEKRVFYKKASVNQLGRDSSKILLMLEKGFTFI